MQKGGRRVDLCPLDSFQSFLTKIESQFFALKKEIIDEQDFTSQ